MDRYINKYIDMEWIELDTFIVTTCHKMVIKVFKDIVNIMLGRIAINIFLCLKSQKANLNFLYL